MATSKNKVNYAKSWQALALARILLGFVFLWAFLDKTMGLGFSTPKGQAWLDGVSPTSGFLAGVSSDNPFASFFHGLAGNMTVDWLFMLGLLGVGLALVLGIGVRLAAVAGTILLGLMWVASFPMKTNPLIDDHVIYAVSLWVVALSPRKWSLIDTWLQTPTVKKNPWLW